MIRSTVLVLALVAVSAATHHNHSDHGSRLGFLSKVRDVAVGGAKIFANVADSSVSAAVKGLNATVEGAKSTAVKGLNTTVEGAKEVAITITDPQAIFPGTRWCGAGTRAQNESEVGLFEGADLCCRDHDNCQDNIQAGDSKHGLNNTGTFTLSHCDCDDQFYKCLKDDGSLIAKKVGFTYFNVLRPKCFREDQPVVRCAKSSGLGLSERCEEYEMDKQSRALEWQWFDAQSF